MNLLTITLLSSIAIAYASNTTAPRIIGGQVAPDGKYPYVVSLRLPGPPWVALHLCGGSIINRRWILTAAHCVENRASLQVVAGTNKIVGNDGQVYLSEYMVAHKNWNRQPKYSNDIGLVRVSRDIQFNDRVQPIRLPNRDFNTVGYPVTLSGWGTQRLGGPSALQLQEITLKVVDQDVCKRAMKKLALITRSHICTFLRAGQGACHGDSGSPLVADGVQIGIASFVNPCAAGDPDVFTRVYTFLDWIAVQLAQF